MGMRPGRAFGWDSVPHCEDRAESIEWYREYWGDYEHLVRAPIDEEWETISSTSVPRSASVTGPTVASVGSV